MLQNIFSGDYYGSDEAKALDFSGYFANQARNQAAMQNNKINQDIALEDLFQTRQMNPLKQEEAVLLNQRRAAEFPGVVADTQKKVSDRALEDSIPFEQRKQLALSKLAKEMSEADLKKEEATLERGIINPATPEPMRKRLVEMRDMVKDVYKLKAQLATKETTAETAATAKVEAVKARGTGGGPKGATDRFAIISKIANPFDKYAALVAYAGELDDTDPNKAKAMASAQAIVKEAQTASEARVSAGKFEKGPDGQWAPVKAPEIVPPGGASPKPSPSAATPPAKPGKLLVYKDGKAVGYIPADQRDQAIKEGYTVK